MNDVQLAENDALRPSPQGGLPPTGPRRLCRLGAVGKVIAVGTGVIGLILVATTSFAVVRYHSEMADAARELRTLDLLLAKDTGRSLQSVSLLLDALAEQLPRGEPGSVATLAERETTLETHELLRARAAGLPQLDAITIIAADGRLVNFSRSWPAPQIQLQDRDYFKVLRDSPREGPYLTEPVINRGSGTMTVYVAKRLQALDGSFQGLLLGAVELAYFERFYQSLLLEPGNVVALWREDGTLLARYPRPDSPPVAMPRGTPTRHMTDDYGPIPGVTRWSYDGPNNQANLVASQSIDGFPLRIDIGRSRAVILKDWRREVVATGIFVAVAIACIVAMMWALVRRFRAYEAVAALGRERERAILARQEVEEALRQSQKMEAVGRLTGGVAHDFNNLLTVIGSSVELLRRERVSAERSARYIDAIANASERAAKLTGQLLSFARRQALEPKTFDVGANVVGVAQMIDRLTGSRIVVTTDLPSAPCYVHADPNQFDTAIVNLAVNARDAMPEGGRLDIVVRCVDRLPAGAPPIHHRGPLVAVSVIDTGMGIAPEIRDRVFEPFFTTKDVGQGTGLGLSQVIGFAKQSGGDVSLGSVVGQGTTFTLHLPFVETMAPSTRPTLDLDAVSNGCGARVLVVDDDPQVGSLTAQLIRELKYFSVTVDSAAEALELLEDDSDGFALVLSDVVMPGMDGLTLARTIDRRYPGLPVVLATGYSAAIADEGVGGFALLRKPFGIEALAHALHDAIAKSRSAREKPHRSTTLAHEGAQLPL